MRSLAHRHRGRRLFIGSAALVALLAGTAGTTAAAPPDAPPASAPAKSTNGIYLVQFADDPAVAYTGGIPGLKATKPTKGNKIDPLDPDVVKYTDYLKGRHADALARSGGRKVYDYVYTYNGVAARLSPAQATALRAQAGVLDVVADEQRTIDTSTTPAFLGLSSPGGVWSQLSGNADGNPIAANGPNSSGAGEGTVIGIVDSGIWPENPSFSDRDADGKLVFQQLPGWHGKCTPGEAFPASNCNQKLIGAQWFNEGFGGDTGVKASFPYEFASARGADGHGSHTAGTAGGNFGVDAVVDGTSLGRLSGMAPRARVAVYKVCWGIPPDGGCFSSDSVAAIDQAVADGVDVLNFSISGSLTSFLDPVEVAFLFAADAGVFVAASAGNSGPTASTVAHNSPWLTTVAAGTHDRQYVASVTLGNGVTYPGVGLGAAVPSAPLVLAVDAAVSPALATIARLCFSAGSNGGVAALDPAKVAGKIVVCDRGVNARTDKSLAVKEAGGVGVVLANTSPNSLNADLHYVPTVHVDEVTGAAVKAYVTATGAGATASLAKGVGGTGAVAPDVAAFSSRGPALAGGGDLLKPDVMAPGVDVLAAVSPVEAGRNFDFLSGTSMSSPHIAGIGALMKQLHPTWSPAAIKSALMTTASQTRNNGTAIPGNPFGFGAGQVTPNSAADPGLVYDAGFNDWFGFLCGTGQLRSAGCATRRIDPSDLNYPSIAIGDLAGVQTVRRTVTNVGTRAETYSASVVAPVGTTVEVTPSSFTVQPGAKVSYTVKVTRTTAALNAFTFGSLTWNGSLGHTVRSPIAVRPVALAAPAGVSGNGAAISYPVQFGYAGSFSAAARGLVPAAVTAGTVNDDPNNSFVPGGPGTVRVDVVVPAGTTYARFELFDADVLAGSDIDLYVYNGVGAQVGASGGGTSAEQVNLVNPSAGTYSVFIHGWQTTGGAPSPFKLHSWVLGSAAEGNMTVSAPATATLGATGTVSLSFSGLAPATRYLGSVAYAGSAGLPSPTIVRVDTP